MDDQFKAVREATRAIDDQFKAAREAARVWDGQFEAVREATRAIDDQFKAAREAARVWDGQFEAVREAARAINGQFEAAREAARAIDDQFKAAREATRVLDEQLGPEPVVNAVTATGWLVQSDDSDLVEEMRARHVELTAAVVVRRAEMATEGGPVQETFVGEDEFIAALYMLWQLSTRLTTDDVLDLVAYAVELFGDDD